MTTTISKNEPFWASPLALIFSLLVHGTIAFLIITNMNRFGEQGDFGQGEQQREVGIYVLDDSQPSESEEEPVEQTPPPTEQLPPVPENLNEALAELPQATPALPNLPAAPLIGPGPAPAMSTAPTAIGSPLAQAAIPPPMMARGIPSTTSFFEIPTQGRSIVYVIDCSGSMSKHNAFRHAKNELTASLKRLDPNLKFQVLFYNDMVFEFRDRRDKPDIHWATAANLQRATAFTSQMDNSGGTDHYQALDKALSYHPEVIFFLTDAAEPPLSARQLDELKRKNGGKATIHCIEFGLGPNLDLENFIRRLSQQNEGTYRYRDMSKLGL